MKKNIIALLLIISITILLFFGRAIPSTKIDIVKPKYSNNSLNISKDIYYRQTLNNCAPYSVMAVINILKGKKIDPEILANEISWRIYKNLTYPQGLVDQLKKNKIETKEYILKNLSKVDKINWLKNKIDLGHPVILLVEINHVKHYFTVIGYDEKGFMAYDSMQEKDMNNTRFTIDDNLSKNGNKYYTNDNLLKLWDDGGYKLFFQNWAVECSLK